MVRKAAGIERVIESIVTRLGDLEQAYLIDDYAQGKDTGIIDLVLVGRIDAYHLNDLTRKTERYIKRKIRSMTMSRDELSTFPPPSTNGPMCGSGRRIRKRFDCCILTFISECYLRFQLVSDPAELSLRGSARLVVPDLWATASRPPANCDANGLMKNHKSSILARAPEVLPRFPVLFAYLYGSHASGVVHPFSDVDIAVFLSEERNDEMMRLESDIALAFDEALDHAVAADVRAINDAPLVLQGEILTEGILIYSCDEPGRVSFETRVRNGPISIFIR